MGFLRVLDHRGEPIPVAAAYGGGYEGATSGTRLGNWGLANLGPNGATGYGLSAMRNRQFEMVRNDPLAGGGVDSLVANMVGRGIRPHWRLDDKALRDEIHEKWAESVDEMDVLGQVSFYGQQEQVARTMCNAGDAFGLFDYPSPYEDLAVPFQVQVIEGGQVDETYTTTAQNGNEIRQGIELDRRGRRVAYHPFKAHPGDPYNWAPDERVRIPVADATHTYRPLRPGMLRGTPWFHSIILKLHEIDQCKDAELVRRKTTTMFGGFIKDINPLALPPGTPGNLPGAAAHPLGKQGGTANGVPVIDLRPGTFPNLPSGKDVTFAQPTDVGGNYVAWMVQQLRDVARGMGITYEQLTGDLSGVNYTSIRAGILDFRRRLEQMMAMTLVFQFCRPVVARWMDTAVLSGALKIADYMRNRRTYLRIAWVPDGWDWVDPIKDVKAAIMEVRAGFNSRKRVVAHRHGLDVEVIDEEISADNERADSAEFVLDSDPRNTAINGIYQGRDEGDDDEKK